VPFGLKIEIGIREAARSPMIGQHDRPTGAGSHRGTCRPNCL
jgi:hypothetical protein